jgi:hypothetical protein
MKETYLVIHEFNPLKSWSGEKFKVYNFIHDFLFISV